MKKDILFIVVCFLLISFVSVAQMKKADKHFLNYDYAKAIPAYEKVIKGKSENRQIAMIKLADCYRVLNNYAKAESYYSQALSLGKVPSDVYYNYGNVLKCNNKYEEALNQYYTFLKDNEKSETAKNAVKSCIEIKYWESKPKEYEIKNIESINTKRSEFCPFVINNKLVFVAEKVSDIVDFETSATNNQPYLNIFTSEIKNNEIKKEKILSKKINTNFHDGPISFSSDAKNAAFTRVDYVVNKKNKNFVNRAKIYFSTVDGNSFSKPKPFAYNSDEYSCAHPSLSSDGSTLFFASDMPGTLGGQDIWMCKKNGDEWDKPVNLGFDINTSGDEVFPSVKADGTLYFSSNGLPGFGDLDIFSAKQKDGTWLLNRNEGLLLNSKSDDFGITFLNDSMGYFSSNREGGKGEDDIYYFKYTSKTIILDGTILLTENINDPAKNIKVFLLDANGKTIDSTKTDDKGYFVFRDLDADKIYMAEIESNDVNLKDKSRYYLIDKNSKITRVTHNNGQGQKFVFKNLPVDPNGMPDLYNEDELNLAGNLLYGENPRKPVANKKIIIKNEFNDIIEETTTNEFGAFAFRNLPLDQNYSISIVDDDLPANTKIILTTKNGKEVKVAYSDTKGKFKFSLLGVDKTTISDLSVNDVDLIMSLSGYLYDQDKNPITNTKVTLFNQSEVIENIITDEKGKFTFKNLGADKNYLFAVDDSDPKFKNITKIYVADTKSRIYKEITRKVNGKYQFNLLDIDKTALGGYTIDDPVLGALKIKNKKDKQTISKLSVNNVDSIMSLSGYLFDQNKNPITNTKVMLFNQSEVIENIITDENGKFTFKNLGSDKNYLFAVDDSDPKFKNITKIYVADTKSRIYKEIKRNLNGKYQFNLLDIDKTALRGYTIDDPILASKKNKEDQKISIDIGNLYYAFGDYHIDTEGKNILDKLIILLNDNKNLYLELSSHTDSRSSDGFNMMLSKKRAMAAVDYLISKGISKSRLTAKGYGETKLLNNCNDEASCSEEDHAKNRRTEFKITESRKH